MERWKFTMVVESTTAIMVLPIDFYGYGDVPYNGSLALPVVLSNNDDTQSMTSVRFYH